MRFLARSVVLAAFILAEFGCGYFRSGTRLDDPGNWQRAFRSTKPADVVVVHSRYWRSPHWTFEFEYFFEIAPHEKLREQLFRENKLRRLSINEAARSRDKGYGSIPAWFAPKPPDNYDIWVHAEEPRGDFQVIIDRETGTIFLSDRQV
ncbi:MAG: hypothetical protein LAO31_21470 [Acidobacteriia bacterium]|nr:hypothetical protein [Terriglobia bacterium]